MSIIQGTQKAWMSDSCHITPREMQAAIDQGKHEYLIGRLNFSNSDMGKYGWVEVGVANIEVTFHPQEAVVEKLADGLRDQIEDKLSQLLALQNLDQKQGAPA